MAAPTVVAIGQQVSDPRVQLAMLMGSYMEGGWGPGYGVGDRSSGGSYGPFQIHLIAHPGVSRAQAEDPSFAVRYMLPAYTSAVAQIPDSTWQSDPKHAAARAAYLAERPAAMYPESRISAAAEAVRGGLNLTSLANVLKFPLRIPGDIKDALGKGASAAGGAVGGAAAAAARSVVSSLWDTVLGKTLFVGLALGLGGVGVYQLFKPQIRATQDRAAELGGIAAKAGV